MRFFIGLIEANNKYHCALRSSSLIYFFIWIQTLQLASLITISGIANVPIGRPLLQYFFEVINFTSITTWQSLAVTQGISIVFVSFLTTHLVSQVYFLLLGWKGIFGEWTGVILFFYKSLSILFEYLFFIPILTWIFFTQVPSVPYSGNNSIYLLNKSPEWLFVVIITLFCIVTVLHVLGKIVDISFAPDGAQDRVKAFSMMFELVQLSLPLCLVILAGKASDEQIQIFWPAAVGCLHALLNIGLTLCFFGYKISAVRRFYRSIMAAYFVHSLLLLVVRELKGDSLTTGRQYIDVIYFISIPIVMKTFLDMDSFLFESSIVSRGKVLGILPTPRQVRFEEMMSLLKGAITTAETLSNRRMFIEKHIVTCKNNSCFCLSWKNDFANSEAVGETPASSLESSQAFIESCYEDLLDTTQKGQTRQGFWGLMDFVLFQGQTKSRPIRACLTLERFKGVYSSFYSNMILEALSLHLRKIFLNTLRNSEKLVFQTSYLDGLVLDATYQRILKQFEAVKQQMVDFYQYLADASPVNLNLLYTKGREFINSSSMLEKELEEYLAKGGATPETLSLLIDFKLNILGRDERAVRSLEKKWNYFFLNKRMNSNLHSESRTQNSYLNAFDSENIYLAIDIASNPGEIINHSSKLYSELGQQSERSKLTLKKILPHQTYPYADSAIKKILGNDRALARSRAYLDLVFLSHAKGHIIPYEVFFKMEFTHHENIQGATILRKIQNGSQYILTMPSGEIISVTDNLLSWLELGSLDYIKGYNVCQFIPELLSFYSDTSDKNNELYSHEMKVSERFETTIFMYLQTQRSRSRGFYRYIETIEMLPSLNQSRHSSPAEPSIRTFVKNSAAMTSLKEEVSKLSEKKYLAFLKVRKLEIDNKVFKVIEVFTCEPLVENGPKSNSPRGSYAIRINHPQGLVLNLPQTRGEIYEDSIEDMRFDIPTERPRNTSDRNLETLGDVRLTDRINDFTSLKETDRPLFSRRQQESDFQTLQEPTVQHTESNTNDIKVTDSGRVDKKDNLKNEYIGELLPYETNFASQNKGKIEVEPTLISQKPMVSFNSSRKGLPSKYAKTPQGDFADLKIVLNESKIIKESSHGSSRPSSKMSFSVKSMIQSHYTYRVLQVNFILGLLGVLLVLALFTAQYAAYKQQLGELISLCTSLSYPMLLGLNLQMLTKEYYKWDLISNDLITKPSWYNQITVEFGFPNYINLTQVYEFLILDGQNVSSEVSLYLSNWSNAIQMNYIDGSTTNMVLPLAAMNLNQAGNQYFMDAVMQNGQNYSTIGAGYILENNTNSFFNKLLNMNAYLYSQVEQNIADILNFNKILIAVVSATIGLLAISCLIMYTRINAKKVKMLALFCTIQKSDLRNECQTINERDKKNKTDNNIALVKKQGKKFGQKLLTDYTYRQEYKWASYILLLTVFASVILPFAFVFAQKNQQIDAAFEGINQIDTWISFEALMSSFFTQELDFYRNLNSNQAYKDSLSQQKLSYYNASLLQYAELQTFLTSFGQLSNQNAYGTAVTQQIQGGLTDVCSNMNQTAFLVDTCRSVCNGIANKGLITATNFLLTQSEDIYEYIYDSSNQSAILASFINSTTLIEIDFLQICINRFLRLTTDLMTDNFVTFMEGINQEAFQTFIGIAVLVFVFLGIGWRIWIKRLENSLNKTKDIYSILPGHILESSSLVKSYFKNEAPYVRR